MTKQQQIIQEVNSQVIERSESNRMKNYKCIYPGCIEKAKTRYNCYTHVWDCHLRYEYAKEGQNPKGLELIGYKQHPEKQKLRKECDKYMVKLVDNKKQRKYEIDDEQKEQKEELYFTSIQFDQLSNQMKKNEMDKISFDTLIQTIPSQPINVVTQKQFNIQKPIKLKTLYEQKNERNHQ